MSIAQDRRTHHVGIPKLSRVCRTQLSPLPGNGFCCTWKELIQDCVAFTVPLYIIHVQLRTKTFTGARACWLMTASFYGATTPVQHHTRRRPNEVVAGHKRKAVALWMLLIFAILACEHFCFFGTAVYTWHIFRCVALSLIFIVVRYSTW